MEKFKNYAKAILVPLLVGGIVGFIISDSIDYTTLEKPFLPPPSIFFPIIWTILYTLMGISYGKLKEKSLMDAGCKKIYYIQLFVNAMWSIFFFTLKWRLFAFIWILLLDLLVIIMINCFYRKNKIAGLLQIPYLLWSLFASYLNLSIYIINN